MINRKITQLPVTILSWVRLILTCSSFTDPTTPNGCYRNPIHGSSTERNVSTADDDTASLPAMDNGVVTSETSQPATVDADVYARRATPDEPNHAANTK